MEIDLELVPRKPPVLHGEGGLSGKGSAEGQSSYYVSFTDLETRGFLRTDEGGEKVMVTGRSWHDHEFSSSVLTDEQVGWDWFSLHLSDGRDLMIFFVRRSDGSVEPASSGTLVEADGSYRHLRLADFGVEVLDRWKSRRSGGRYPSRWRVRVPDAGIDLVVAPLVAGQELVTGGAAGIVYWEGAVAGEGSSSGRRAACEGYVELTGYAGRTMGGLF